MVEVVLPTLHADQVKAYRSRTRYQALRCGRRWGKSKYGETIACDAAARGKEVGWFAPDYKTMSEVFYEIVDILTPILSSANKVEMVIRTKTGGRIDFWTLDNERAGRSRRYHLVVIDEAAFTDAAMKDTWQRAIEPTLLDFNGSAVVMSNTNGEDPDNFFWQICHDKTLGFTEYHAPTFANPLLPLRRPNETEEEHKARRMEVFIHLKESKPPLVFRQEHMAEFVDWSGDAFFHLDKLFADGHPMPLPRTCATVGAVIDSATKTGKENDGTAVVFFAYENLATDRPLLILDWDYVQIEGDMLIDWLPSVYQRLDDYARRVGARMGSLGVYIEDKASGEILLQQALRRGYPAQAIDSRLTALGKVERAISVSGYVWQQLVGMTTEAHEKLVTFKGVSRNHLESQIKSFRVDDKDANKKADDLLDCFTYGIALSLGNSEGF